MKQPIVSHFSDKPVHRLTWWAMGLGLPTLFLGPLLGFSASVVLPAIARAWGNTTGQSFGISFGLFAFLLTIAAIVVGSISLRRGERSWVLWLGYLPALLAGVFWVFMIVGELVFPH